MGVACKGTQHTLLHGRCIFVDNCWDFFQSSAPALAGYLCYGCVARHHYDWQLNNHRNEERTRCRHRHCCLERPEEALDARLKIPRKSTIVTYGTVFFSASNLRTRGIQYKKQKAIHDCISNVSGGGIQRTAVVVIMCHAQRRGSSLFGVDSKRLDKKLIKNNNGKHFNSQ